MPEMLVPPLNSFDSLLRARAQAMPELRDTIDALYQRGWALGTSGNFSTVLSRSPLRLLITASGRDKGRLGANDFVIVDSEGRSVESATTSSRAPTARDDAPVASIRTATPATEPPKPSAETLLHVVLAQRQGAGAVLHTHSIWNTLLSDLHFAAGAVSIRGYEMLKGLAGITTHDCEVQIPIFDNTQNIPTLAGAVAQHLQRSGPSAPPAFLIRGHGLYAWGCDLAEARRHVEVLEFLFEVLARKGHVEPRPVGKRCRTAARNATTATESHAEASITMAVVRIPDSDTVIREDRSVAEFLRPYGILFERWPVAERVSPDASSDDILTAYAPEIDELKRRGGYVTADVINVTPDTPNLDTLLNKFNKEHRHSEDEVRFIVKGNGVFHIHADDDCVFGIEVCGGDMITVPAGTRHWFDLCGNRTIRAIRLFLDMSGWTPEYVANGVHAGYPPICLGPQFIAAEQPALSQRISV